jgi:CTP:molybdopterin cytidylyltransferase MocA
MSSMTTRAPVDPSVQGVAMSAGASDRIGSLLAEAETRRLVADVRGDSARRRLGRALVAVGRTVEGRTVVEPAAKRPGQPAAGAHA